MTHPLVHEGQVIDRQQGIQLGSLQVLELDQEMLKLAEQLKTASSLLMFGRGFNYATALEAALKVRHLVKHFTGAARTKVRPGCLLLTQHHMLMDCMKADARREDFDGLECPQCSSRIQSHPPRQAVIVPRAQIAAWMPHSTAFPGSI